MYALRILGGAHAPHAPSKSATDNWNIAESGVKYHKPYFSYENFIFGVTMLLLAWQFYFWHGNLIYSMTIVLLALQSYFV